jgi:protein CpxP
MDKFKLLTYSVIGLILLNLGIIGFIYISMPNSNPNDKRRPKDIIIEKLHFDDNQIKKYEIIIEAHRNFIDSLNKNNREIKAELYSKLKQSHVNVKDKDSLIQIILLNHKYIEEGNFMHFQDIKNLCTKSQLEDFNSLTEVLEKLFSNQNRKPRPEYRHPPRPDFDNTISNKSKSSFPPPHWDHDSPERPGDENRPPHPPRE